MTVIVVLYFIAFKVNSMVVDCIEFCILSSLNFTLTYALTIYFPMGRPLGHPQGSQGEWYNLGISFFLAGDLKTTSTKGTYPRILFEFCSVVYRSRPKFFRANLFHSDRLFAINFMPFTQGVGMVLFVMKNDFPAVYPSGSK